MARFSLAPPTRGNGDLKSIDIVGFPDIEVIKQFAEGEIGIAQSAFEGFFSKYSAGLPDNVSEIFTNLSNNLNGGSWGLKGLERVTVKSIFETQKPYMEVALTVLDSLVVVEDIIAVLLAGQEFQSLKPKTNDKSLYTKLNGLTGDLDELKKSIAPQKSIFSNNEKGPRSISEEELSGIFDKNKNRFDVSENTIGDFDWVTPEPSVVPQIEYDDNFPTVIFDIWVDEKGDGSKIYRLTDMNLLPNDWNVGDKYQGTWEGWTDDEFGFRQEYTTYVDTMLIEEMTKNGIDKEVQKEVREIVKNSLPFDNPDIDFYEDFKKGVLWSQLYDEYKKSSDDSLKKFVKKLNDQSKFGYKPKKVNGVWVNPETDYNLQMIRVIPSSSETNNKKLSGNKPLVANYGGEKIEDILQTGDYNQSNYSYRDQDRTSRLAHIRYRKSNTGSEKPATRELKYGTYNSTKKQFSDTARFYIIEGVYKNRIDVKEDQKSGNVNNGSKSERWYRYGTSNTRPGLSMAAAVAKFSKFGASALPKIITTANTAIETFNDPFNLIFEIIMEKMGDSYDAFGEDFSKLFSELKTKETPQEKRDFIKSDPKLRNFVSLDSENNYKFIFDGVGVLSFLGMNFGIGIKNFLPDMSLEVNGLPSLACDEDNDFDLLNGRPPDRGSDLSGNYSVNNNKSTNDENSNTSLGGSTPQNNLLNDSGYEVVNVEYSTGDFVEGVNYKYYYITLDNQALVNKSSANLEKAKQIKDSAESIRLKLLAMEDLQKAQVKDPGNLFINQQIQELQKEDGVQTNMMIQFIMNLIVLPIKIVLCIISYILDFFKSIKVIDLPKKIPEFLGFDWILKFFKPTVVLELLGIKFNPDFNALWLAKSKIVSPDFKFDASQILDAPFLGKLPLYSALQFPNIVIGGPKISLTMGGLFTFLESLVNSILCFLFNIFNLDKLFPCPAINLSRFTDDSLSEEDRQKLLAEADFNFINNDPNNRLDNSELNNAFVFDIELEDGTIIKGLNRAELQAYVASNRNLKYKYNF
jgi:hypothetical protein